jgi:hypothetical protein
MFTPDELKQIEKIPMPQMFALIADMVEAAKVELFKHIAVQTGTMPPFDYMLTHKQEFSGEWASGEDHSIASVWTWKGKPVVFQSGTICQDGENIVASVRTEAYRFPLTRCA